MVSGWLVLTPMGTSGRMWFRVLPGVIPANIHVENQSKTLAGSHPVSDTRPTLVSHGRRPQHCAFAIFCVQFVPPPLSLNSMIKQNSNFQEFNTLSTWWVLLLSHSCNRCYFALSNIVLDVLWIESFLLLFLGPKRDSCNRCCCFALSNVLDVLWIESFSPFVFGSFGRWS